MSILYYAFGSNMLPSRLTARTPSAVPMAIKVLIGWRLAFHKLGQDGSGKGNIVETRKNYDQVYGVLYELDEFEKPILDRIEGEGYQEHWMKLDNGRDYYMYVADSESIKEGLKPFDWYRDLVEAGARWHRFPQSYIENITQFESVADSDQNRSQRARDIILQSQR